MYKLSSESYANSLDIAEQLIKRKKIPFRESHKLVGALVDYAIKKESIPLGLLNKEDIHSVLVKTNFLKYEITSDEIYLLIKDITAEKSIIHRITKGSPNKNEQLIMILNLNQKIKEYQKKIDLRVEYIKNSIKELKTVVEKNINEIS